MSGKRLRRRRRNRTLVLPDPETADAVRKNGSPFGLPFFIPDVSPSASDGVIDIDMRYLQPAVLLYPGAERLNAEALCRVVTAREIGNSGFLRDVNGGLGDFALEVEIRALIHGFLEEPLSGA